VECDNFLQEDRNGQVFDGGDYYTDIETFRSYERVWKDLTCVAQSGAHPIASSIGSTRTNFQDKRFCWFVVEIVQSGQSRQSIRLWCPNPPAIGADDNAPFHRHYRKGAPALMHRSG
jgi:hypothetical protein